MGPDASEWAELNRLPDELVAELSDLDRTALRSLRSFATAQLVGSRRSVEELLEPRPGEELVDVRESETLTLVRKTQPCLDGCDDCPHGPFLYAVRERTHDEREPTTDWCCLGAVRSPGEVE